MAIVMQSLIEDLVKRIADHCRPKRIVLFGSFMKGTVHSGSDIDLLVIWNTEVPRSYREAELKHLVAECPIPVDLIVLTSEEYEDECRKPYSRVLAASSSGVTMYDN